MNIPVVMLPVRFFVKDYSRIRTEIDPARYGVWGQGTYDEGWGSTLHEAVKDYVHKNGFEAGDDEKQAELVETIFAALEEVQSER